MLDQIRNDIIDLYTSLGKVSRLQHVFGVVETARKLGVKHKCDLDKLEMASLLHDITKYEPFEYHKKVIEENFSNHEFILKDYNRQVLHAFSARVYALKNYSIKDKDVLDSIENHTIGKKEMSIYEKIIFISDYIEPNRTYESCIKVRAIAETNLDLAVYQAIDDSITFYEKLNSQIPQAAYEAREYYKELLEVQHGKN